MTPPVVGSDVGEEALLFSRLNHFDTKAQSFGEDSCVNSRMCFEQLQILALFEYLKILYLSALGNSQCLQTSECYHDTDINKIRKISQCQFRDFGTVANILQIRPMVTDRNSTN